MPIDFSDDLLEQAKAGLARLKDCYAAILRITEKNNHDGELFDIEPFIVVAKRDFEAAMDDDFEISRALAALFDLVAEVNRRMKQEELGSSQARKVLHFFDQVDSVLAILKFEDTLDAEVQRLIDERNEARRKKDFKRSDEIRRELEKRGILLEDTKDGTLWKKAL